MEEANPNERTEFTAAQIWEVCALSFNVEGKEVWNCPHCKGQFVGKNATKALSHITRIVGHFHGSREQRNILCESLRSAPMSVAVDAFAPPLRF
jgi:hypothetical protein